MNGDGAPDVQHLLDDVRRLQDIEEIEILRSRYYQHVDAQDWEAWGREVLTEDFVFETADGIQEGRDAVLAAISRALDGARTIHHGHTPEITITGPDTATGIWAMNSIVSMTFDGAPIVRRGWGHYHDDYVRTTDGWRIARSVLTPLRVEVVEVLEVEDAP